MSAARRALLEALDRAPTVSLIHRPTPLEPLPRLTAYLGGPTLYVKRDDLTGLTFGGNKSRMFEYVLGPLVVQGVDTIVAGAMVQSNYCRQLAGACARLDLACHLLLRPVAGLDPGELQANLLLDHLAGARMELLPEGTDWTGQLEAIESRAEALRRQGRRVGVPQHHKVEGALAYAACVLELESVWRNWERPPAAVVVTSSESTQAGLLVGMAAVGAPVAVVGVSPSPGDAAGSVARLAQRLAERLGHPELLAGATVQNTSRYAGEALAVPTAEGLEALRLLMRLEGLPLDPVYTAKGMAALMDQVRRGRWGPEERVVFVHTGGLPLLFAYGERLVRE